MSEWMRKLIGQHTCYFCEEYVNKKEIYSVDVNTQDGPLNLKTCKECAKHVDEMLKELEEVLAERNKSF